MKNPRSYPDPRSQGSGDAIAADDDDEGNRKSMRAAQHGKRKDCSPSPVSGFDAMDLDGAATPGTWTGEKKTKNQRDDGDLGRIDEQPDKRVHAADDDEQDWLKSIEEYEWDDDFLEREIKKCFDYLSEHHMHPPSAYREMDYNQCTELESRLDMYRSRACKDMGIDIPSEMNTGDYERLELKLGWFFDFFQYSGFDDYQRLMVRISEVEYIDGTSTLASVTRCTLEGDKQYLEFWNRLSSEIKWYRKAQTVAFDVREKLGNVACYRAMKIGKDFPKIHATLIFSALDEYKLCVRYETCVDKYVSLYFELWKLVAKEKIGLREAMERLIVEEKFPLSNRFLKRELNEGFGPITANYKTYFAGIDGTLHESDAFPLIKKAYGETRKGRLAGRRKTYYDYAKEKLKIAEEIGVLDYLTKQKLCTNFCMNDA